MKYGIADEDYRAILAALTNQPQTYEELSARSRLTVRKCQKAIRRARLEHKPVSSDGRGMWIPTLAELRETEARLLERAQHQLATYQAVKETRERLEFGSGSLWDAAPA